MPEQRHFLRVPVPVRQAVILAVAVVLAFGGGAVARAKYDATNAHKVDGKHAVGARASIQKRAGQLVATDRTTGKLPSNIIATAPDAEQLGGYTHAEMSATSIPPQGVGVSGSATQGTDGVFFSAAGTGELRFGVVVPADHKAGTPLLVDLVYREDSPGACSWAAATSGLEGPDSPTGSDIHNGGWQFPGSGSGYSGIVAVPAGAGSVHTTTFNWPFQSDPGMFVQFAVNRLGDAADTCSGISVYGIQYRY